MPSVYDVYTFYISPADLQGLPRTVAVERSELRQVFNPNTNSREPRVILRFHGKKKVLKLNKMQAGEMIDVTGTDDYSRWVGHTIILNPIVVEGEPTIKITKPKPVAPAQPPVTPEEKKEEEKEPLPDIDFEGNDNLDADDDGSQPHETD